MLRTLLASLRVAPFHHHDSLPQRFNIPPVHRVSGIHLSPPWPATPRSHNPASASSLARAHTCQLKSLLSPLSLGLSQFLRVSPPPTVTASVSAAAERPSRPAVGGLPRVGRLRLYAWNQARFSALPHPGLPWAPPNLRPHPLPAASTYTRRGRRRDARRSPWFLRPVNTRLTV